MRPERILLIRSARHLGIALNGLALARPGCQITVLATPGIDSTIAADPRVAGCLTYSAAPRFRPAALLKNGLALRLWRMRFDRVVVLWPDRDGTDQANVDHTALLIAPRGFDAITPAGEIVTRGTASLAAREIRRAAVSLSVLGVLALLLYIPAAACDLICSLCRRCRPDRRPLSADRASALTRSTRQTSAKTRLTRHPDAGQPGSPPQSDRILQV